MQFRYIPLDISSEMIDVAEKTVSTNFPGSEIRKVVLDFELGNFSDRNRILTNLRDSMGTGDFLLVGVEMTNFSKVTKLVSHYINDEVESLLLNIPLEVGVKKSAIEYEVEWNDKENQIECWMILKDDQKINIGSDSFKLEKDEKILLARSVKFNEWTFTKLMSDVGFRTELLTTTKDRGYVLSLVQPTRYNV